MSLNISNSWVDGQPLPAAELNENFTELESFVNTLDTTITSLNAMTDLVQHTPSLSATGGSPTWGSATVSGRYAVSGDVCILMVHVTGATDVVLGTGEVTLGLPNTAVDNGKFLGVGVVTDGGTAPETVHVKAAASGSAVTLWQEGGSASYDAATLQAKLDSATSTLDFTIIYEV